MRVSILALASAAFLACASPLRVAANYNLHANYDARNWLQSFDFWTDSDPTHGFVDFQSAADAQNQGMLAFNRQTQQVYMGVDHDNWIPTNSRGRKSIRIQTKEQFTTGLFVLDLQHAPGQICGTWPAFWSTGPNWPQGGEIDVLEGANNQNYNVMSLHTNPGCWVNADGAKSGTWIVRNNCDSNSNGCSEQNADPSTYGDGFNQHAGGVYAYEWTNDHISIWTWPRDQIPWDIQQGKPNPGSWGAPSGRFSGTCNLPAYFWNHNIIFDNTFCGDWAGNTFNWQCPNKGSCQEYVAGNPHDFYEAYWLVNSLKIYKNAGVEAEYLLRVEAHQNATAQFATQGKEQSPIQQLPLRAQTQKQQVPIQNHLKPHIQDA